jgi:hypothetical protein
LIVTGVALALNALTAKANTFRSGVACGFAFSTPVVLACLLLLKLNPHVGQWHGEALLISCLQVVVVSVVAMIYAAKIRAD